MDTIETYNWLTTPRARGGVGVDPKRMIVMGDSAGGGLSTALGLALVHNEKNPLYNPLNYPFQSSAKQSITAEQLRNLKAPALLILLSPWLDLECKNASW